MKEICSFSKVLSHLGLLKLGLTFGLFLMLVEAIVEAGVVDKEDVLKAGVVVEAEARGGDEESLEDKLRQHLAAAANITQVRLHHLTIFYNFTIIAISAT